jgi:GDP-mannose 6-dehydrogenase
MLEFLIGKGRELRVFDPHIRLDAIYGSNRNFILNAIPHIGRLMENRLEDVLGWADHLVITQKLNPELNRQVTEVALPVLDLSVGQF